MMKALSLLGDYVMDIIRGQKKIEYRSWQTKYRGPILLCSTVKKVHGAVPGYALCVAMIKKIEWNDWDQCYYWHIEPFEKGSSYLIEPIHVKGMQHLFNVDDQLIKPAPFVKYSPNDAAFCDWWEDKIEPLIYE